MNWQVLLTFLWGLIQRSKYLLPNHPGCVYFLLHIVSKKFHHHPHHNNMSVYIQNVTELKKSKDLTENTVIISTHIELEQSMD